MNFDLTTFAFQLVNVLVLLAILRHFLFKPVVEIIARRRAETEAAMAAAEAAKTDAAAAKKAAEAEAEATRAARHDVLADARKEAEAERARLVQAAQQEAQRIAEGARAGAEETRAAAEAGLLNEARELAQAIAARAMAAQPKPPNAAAYAERLVTALAAIPEAARQALLSAPDLSVLTPAELTEGEAASLRDRLVAAGAPASVPVTVEPALIAGLELRSGAGVVHNSLAHDLEQLAKAMRDGGHPGN
ncbi:ATP synthase F0 subunit B [Sinirhodobacter sp. WL0062]|uniref:ATP synthase subunit b n=1 Tax=Rhodobacter flavimaris TaxID=2907145 RepID=A0ABS8YQU8_9RHOB|nr:ATP synthase F0 subunit B [Sinirhodobacter sp. WL0062]MCE5972058.1 ATP synthase F0 subunit B [Sinirhodobacter sp. WL0062]